MQIVKDMHSERDISYKYCMIFQKKKIISATKDISDTISFPAIFLNSVSSPFNISDLCAIETGA